MVIINDLNGLFKFAQMVVKLVAADPVIEYVPLFYILLKIQGAMAILTIS